MRFLILILFMLMHAGLMLSQSFEADTAASIDFKGQVSAWGHANASNELPLWTGGRYIPEIEAKLPLEKSRLIDFDLSLNLYGSLGTNFQDSTTSAGKIKPYRAWVRYSTPQFELRAGLQKINFGSASMLRPLMWFDQLDPRDPLQLTDGVWGILARYYFLNNSTLWLWGLYGNDKPKGWESLGTNSKVPELGGRIQTPIPLGEGGISYHYRQADSRGVNTQLPEYAHIPEHRLGIDLRFDWIIGAWLEGSWTHKTKELYALNNQEIINLGMDYTFGIGNGISMVFEQLLATSDQEAFQFENRVNFSLLSLTYPVGLFDNISTILYFNWNDNSLYSFLNWQHEFKHISLHLIGYWNPENYQIPTQQTAENLFSGRGVQVMVVWDY